MIACTAKYNGSNQSDFYDDQRGIICVVTEHGTMWLPLIYTGWSSLKFDVEEDTVIALIFDEANAIYDLGRKAVANGIAIIIKDPPHMVGKPLLDHGDEANMPTKLMAGSASSSEERHIGGTAEAKIVATDDMLLLKGPNGNQIAICKDGIVTKGKQIGMDFFNSSKAGIIKENWLGAVLPTTVSVWLGNVAPYTIDMEFITGKIEGLTDIYKSMQG
jgi:hypothetical protein